VRAQQLDAAAAVAADKSPAQVERAFRSIKTVDLHVRPVIHYPKVKIILNTRPTPLQAKAFALLGVSPAFTQ